MISISWKCHVWGKRIIWERHTKQKQSYVMGKEFWGKKKIYLGIEVLYLAERGICMSIFSLRTPFQTSYRDLSSPFSWWKIGLTFSFGKISVFTFAKNTISAEGLLPWGSLLLLLERATLTNTQQPCAVPGNLPGHTAAPPYPQPVPGSLLWRMDGVGNKRWQEGYEEQEK